MKKTCTYIFLFLLALCFIAPVADAEARRRNRARYAGVGKEIMPDAIPTRTPSEGKATPALALKSGLYSGHINSRFREGIDVSHYQGHIDWAKVAKSQTISYVYLKATEGESFVDRTYHRNLREVRRVGLSVGSYHFYRPNISPQLQFENIRRNVKREHQDLVPMIDIEVRGRVSDAQFIRDLKKLIKLVENHYGKKPLLYSYQNFYNRHLVGHFPGYHWMMAKYHAERPYLTDNADYIMWQYTAEGQVDGVKGPVDRSRIMGDHVLKEVGF